MDMFRSGPVITNECILVKKSTNRGMYCDLGKLKSGFQGIALDGYDIHY